MTTYDITNPNPVSRVRLTIGDTNVNAAVFTDAEIDAFLARYQGLGESRQEDWASAEMLDSLLTNDSRLIGKSSILGVDLDSVSWRDACKDRVGYLRERHIRGPS